MADLDLLPSGIALVSNRESYKTVVVGGMGGGKTAAIAAKALIGTLENNGADTLIVYPNYSFFDSVFLPQLTKTCAKVGITYRRRGRDEVYFNVPGRAGKLLFRSTSHPHLLVGFEVGMTIVDEGARQTGLVDEIAVERTRSPDAKRHQIIYASTPEGYNWFYDVATKPSTAVIKALPIDNVHLPVNYVKNLLANLDEDDARAYVYGEFVGKSGGVYRHFSRATHCRPCTNPLDGELIIGADFNVDAMSWVFMRKIGDEIHAFAELTDGGDTIEQAELAKELLHKLARTYGNGRESGQDLIRRTTIVPDASSASRKTSATMTDKDHMRKAGFAVVSAPSNPLVRDRVFSVNHAFRMGKLFVDGDKCPALVKCLEQQTYNKYGDPDKTSGLDHGVDALGYAVMRYMPSYSIRTMHRAQQLSKHNWSNAA